MTSRDDFVQRIRSGVSEFVQAVADIQFLHDCSLEYIEGTYNKRMAELQAARQQAAINARTVYEAQAAKVKAEAEALRQAIGVTATGWSAPFWTADPWVPLADGKTPQFTRLGQLLSNGYHDQLVMPALMPLIGGRPLLIKAGAPFTAAAGGIQALLFRLLATIAPGKLRFTFIDPIGLGQNVAPFLQLADYDEALVTGKAWTEPQHIEACLGDLAEHMENVIQKYLRNHFADIEDYNAQAGEVAEPHRVLTVFDFPANFSDTAARRLVSIVQNGPRCGVYAVILADVAKPLPYDFNMSDLEQACTVIAQDGANFVWQDPDFKECLLELDRPPEKALFNRIVDAVGAIAKENSKIEVPFELIAPPEEAWWTCNSGGGLRLPLGPAGARRLQYLDLGAGTAQHVLIAGKTGSGKSTLLHTLITNLALLYSPDETELYLVDFKKGVEFKTYATHALPHARVVAVESEREFGLSVLQGLDAELKRRGDLLRAAGVDHIADYRQRTGRTMPRILLIVDEFQEFFTEDDQVAAQTAQILDRIVRQGRAFGMHALLGSQTLAGAYTLARSTIDQMAVRIALQCSEADSRLILADDNPAARLLARPGEGIYNADNGMVEGNNRFQVAWLDDDERDRYLHGIAELAVQRGYRRAQPQIVFEGNASAHIAANQSINDLRAQPAWPQRPRALRAWLGEPVAISDPLAALFRRQSGSNLLIVGQSDEAAIGLLGAALVSMAAQLDPAQIQFDVLDFNATDAAYADFFSALPDYLPHRINCGRRRHLQTVIDELAAEVETRVKADNPAGPVRFLIINALHRARDLRPDDSLGLALYTDETARPSTAEQFAAILRDGPEVGVHTITWCDTLTNLNRSLDRRAMREFAMRVAFQMSAEDSANLIDLPAASKLGPHRALFYSEDEGRLEKFRPYAVAPAEWLSRVGACLKDRSRQPVL